MSAPQTVSPQAFSHADALARAVSCYQGGRLRDAERLCRQLLRARSDHVDAHHLLALVLQDRKRPAEALTSYDKALALRPDLAEAHNNRGSALIELGRYQEAAASAERALALQPKYPEALVNLAIAFGGLGRHADALASCDRALAIWPQSVEALNRRSIELIALKRYQEAVADYDRVLRLNPEFVSALNNRATALIELGRFHEALADCDRALANDPDYVEAHYNRAAALNDLKRPHEALASYDRALALEPDHVEALNSRGVVLDDLGRHEEAQASYARALALRPDYAEALDNLGTSLIEVGRYDDALANYDAALAIDGDYVECRWNRSLLLLRLGRFDEGFREYEWRRKRAAWKPRTFAAPEWSGDNPDGKRLLFYAEQGLGDTIQFARFARAVAAKGGEVILEVQPPLRALLGRMQGVTVVRKGDPLPLFDAHLPLMSVPRVLDAISGEPYLTADPDRVAAWSKRLPRDAFNIGIVWQGNPYAKCERGRSIPLRAFAPLAAIPGVRFISLQKNEGAEQLRDLPAGMVVETLGDHFDCGSDAFLDSAAVLMNLDLVITSDTAMAHLAGALGRPTWVALQKVPDWRWMLEREDTPWYPTLRLFRQAKPGDWAGLFARIAGELAKLVDEVSLSRARQKQAQP